MARFLALNFLIFLAFGSKCLATSLNTGSSNNDYIFLGLQGNFPVAESTGKFSSGYRHPSLAYMHDFANQWIMGLGLNFKILYRTDTKKDIAIAALNHEIAKRIRLSYPTYLDIGAQTMFLLPSETAKLPLQKTSEFGPEIGAGIYAQVIHHFSGPLAMGVRVGRWRGTGTKQIQCLETAAILGWMIDSSKTSAAQD